MARTPLIRRLQNTGGTFYAFSSAAEDLGFTFNNSNNKFRFSKFVLLDLPEFNSVSSTSLTGPNYIKFGAPDSAFLDAIQNNPPLLTFGNGPGTLEASFQSYCLNLEALAISDPGYNSSLKKTISERVFWKWVKELGGVRFRPASTNEVVPTLDQVTITTVNGIPSSQKRFVEEDETTIGYKKVVKYIGEIDVVNSVKNSTNAYSEVYIHVPTSHGRTPTVLFKVTADENYGPSRTWTNNPINPLDSEYIYGRTSTTVHPDTLPTLAIYDQDVTGRPGITGANSATGATFSGNWYSPRSRVNSYFTEATFFNPSTDLIFKSSTNPTGAISYTRSRLDGIEVDFDPASYKEIVDNPSLRGFSDYNASSTTDFSFNTILIYYDVYDPNNPTDFQTNLYGVLFVDSYEFISPGYRIKRFDKYKPNLITKNNGNSYGLKLNIKFDSDVTSNISEQSINDYSSFSLSAFMDAANIFKESARILNDRTNSIIQLENQMAALKDLVLNQENTDELKSRITNLENAMQANQSLFNNTQEIINLIRRNTDSINAILSGNTNIVISYDLDLLKSGIGTFVDRSVQNRLKIDNTVQSYSVDTDSVFTLNPGSGNTLILKPFSNYYKHKNNGIRIVATNSIEIKIDDTLTPWKKGQSFKLVFDDPVDLGNFSLVILTNATGRYPLPNPTNVAYSTVVTAFSDAQFLAALQSEKPIFEIICTNDIDLAFEVDQIR